MCSDFCLFNLNIGRHGLGVIHPQLFGFKNDMTAGPSSLKKIWVDGLVVGLTETKAY